MQGAVEVRLELGSVFGNPSTFSKAEHLIPAAVGQDGSVPSREAVQTSKLANELIAGTQVEVIRVPQDDLSARILHVLEEHSLHGSLRPHRHEGGCLDDAMRRGKLAEPGTSIGTCQREAKRAAQGEMGSGDPLLWPL